MEVKGNGNNQPDSFEDGEIKSALEIALERSSKLDEESVTVETENGQVSMTFQELKQKAVERDEFLTRLQYLQAEFENYRKRTIREKEDLIKESIQVVDLFDLYEHLERALESTGEASAILEGVRLIRDQFWNLLEKKGVEKVGEVGEDFDPNFHEAISQQADQSIPAGKIKQVYQMGFKIDEKLLRPTKVVVSTGTGE